MAVTDDAVIVVVATGSADVEPDRVRIEVGVSVVGGTVPEALSSVAAAQERLLESAVESGIPRSSIQTRGYHVGQDYDPRGGPTGQRAEVSSTIVVDDVGRAGALIGCMSAAAGDALRVHGIRLETSDAQPATAEARAAAVRSARGQAEELAAAAGVRLGRLRSLVEGAARQFTPQAGGAMVAAAASVAPGIEGGVLAAQVVVTATYEIDDRG